MQALELLKTLPETINAVVNPSVLEFYGCLSCGTGGSNEKAENELSRLTAESLFLSSPSNEQMANCCLAGLWLLHGFLDRSHEISQSMPTDEGSYWHGIMHRLEGDFWNSKYWLGRVEDHPVTRQLSDRHAGYPNHFIDATEVAFSNGFDEDVASLAIEEWTRLFEFCYQSAI